MNFFLKISIIVLLFLGLIPILHSCKKEELPTLSTSSIINITATSASSGGVIISDGGAGVTARGICWSSNANPTTSDSKTVDGKGTGQFGSNINGLTPGSAYHVRAYATNSVGTAYGADLSFATLGQVPGCITQPATNMTSSGATLNGTVNANYLSTTVTFEYGITISYGQTVTSAQSPVTGNNMTNVSADISGLNPGTTYHFKVKSVNSLGATNGIDLTFITVSTIPTLTTSAVSNVTTNSATTGGNITADGGASITARGVCWATTLNPTTTDNKTSNGTGNGAFTSNLTGLNPNTTYYVRAYAINSVGTAYGNEISFPTIPILLATLTTNLVTSITEATAISGGNITNDGGGSIIERGICWATHENPTTNDNRTSDGTGIGSFPSIMNCLSFATTYYVRAYAINSAGIAYGEQQSFPTQGINPIIFNPNLTYGSVSDIDGNCYKTIQIGDQTWMAENLKTTKFNDRKSIPLVADSLTWAYLTTPGYCWYNNDETAYKTIYGALYNGWSINTSKLCPAGWHVSSMEEWRILANYLGGPDIAGGKLKETGITHWINPNISATNEVGFTALPGGWRIVQLLGEDKHNSNFSNIGNGGAWWGGINLHVIGNEGGYLISTQPAKIQHPFHGLSVRCVKD